jgi:hypothetical protein
MPRLTPNSKLLRLQAGMFGAGRAKERAAGAIGRAADPSKVLVPGRPDPRIRGNNLGDPHKPYLVNRWEKRNHIVSRPGTSGSAVHRILERAKARRTGGF